MPRAGGVGVLHSRADDAPVARRRSASQRTGRQPRCGREATRDVLVLGCRRRSGPRWTAESSLVKPFAVDHVRASGQRAHLTRLAATTGCRRSVPSAARRLFSVMRRQSEVIFEILARYSSTSAPRVVQRARGDRRGPLPKSLNRTAAAARRRAPHFAVINRFSKSARATRFKLLRSAAPAASTSSVMLRQRTRILFRGLARLSHRLPPAHFVTERGDFPSQWFGSERTFEVFVSPYCPLRDLPLALRARWRQTPSAEEEKAAWRVLWSRSRPSPPLVRGRRPSRRARRAVPSAPPATPRGSNSSPPSRHQGRRPGDRLRRRLGRWLRARSLAQSGALLGGITGSLASVPRGMKW